MRVLIVTVLTRFDEKKILQRIDDVIELSQFSKFREKKFNIQHD